MAQVRKLQSGGNTEKLIRGSLNIDGAKVDRLTKELEEKAKSEKPKYGRIIINGEVVNDRVTDEDISRWFEDDDVGRGLSELLRSGIDVEMTKTGENEGSINATGIEKYLNPKSKAYKSNRFGFQNKYTKADNDSLKKYLSRDYSMAPESHTTYDFSKDLNLEYDVNAPDLVTKTPEWSMAQDRIREYLRLSKEGLNEGIYNWHKNSGFKGGLNPDGQDVRNYIGRVSDRLQSYLDSDFSIWDESDLKILKSLGINITDKTRFDINEAKPKTGSGTGTQYSGLGLDVNNTNVAALGLTPNQDGTYSISKEWLTANPQFNRVHITGDWLVGRAEFEPLKGGFFYDGMYIPKSIAEDPNSTFHKNIIQFYRPANIAGEENSLGIDRWGNTYNQFSRYDPTSEIYTDLYRSPKIKELLDAGKNLWVAQYTTKDGHRGYSYYDDDEAGRDIWGIPLPEYIRNIVFDSDTSEGKWAPEGIMDYSTKEQGTRIEESKEYPGYYEMQTIDPDGNSATFYISFTNDDVYFKSKDMDAPYKLTDEEKTELIGENKKLDFTTIPTRINKSWIGPQSRKDWSRFWRRILTSHKDEDLKKLEKHQFGGTVKPNAPKYETPVKVDKIADASKSANINDIGNAKTDFDTSDYLQMASLLFDSSSLLASLGTGTVPNIVSAGTGVLGTILDLGAGIYRGDNIGSILGNLAGNIAGDVYSPLGIAKSLKKSASLLNTAFSIYGLKDAAVSLNNIISTGDFKIDDLQNLVNGLTIVVKGNKGRKKKDALTPTSAKSKTKVDITSERNKYIDDYISKPGNKNVTNVSDANGNSGPAEWFDPRTGKVKPGANPNGKSYYDLAYEGLKGKKKGELNAEDDFSFDETGWIERGKVAAKQTKESVKSNLNKSWMPWSDNYRYNYRTRRLTKVDTNGKVVDLTPDEIRDFYSKRGNKYAMQKLYYESPYIREQMNNAGIKLKKGGIIKAQNGDTLYTSKKPKFNLENQLLSLGNIADALMTEKKALNHDLKALDAARHNIGFTQMETPRFSSAQLDRSRGENIRLINNTLLPMTNDPRILTAGKLAKEMQKVDINNSYADNLTKSIDKFNELNRTIKYNNSVNAVNAANKMFEMEAKINSGKESRLSNYELAKYNIRKAGWDQLRGEALNNLYSSQRANDIREDQLAYEDYMKSTSKINAEMKSDMEKSGLGDKYYSSDRYNHYMDRLSAAYRNYMNRSSLSQYNTRINQLTGLPDYTSPVISKTYSKLPHIGKTVSLKKGGKTKSEDYNNERILEVIRAQYEEISKTNDRILKLLLNIFN